MDITLTDLEVVFKLIIDKLKISGFENFDCQNDYYWHVGAPEWTDMKNDPAKLNVGSLFDDWDELKKAVNRNFITPVDLQRLAAILNIIADKWYK